MGWHWRLFRKRKLSHFDLKAYLKTTYEKKIETAGADPAQYNFARLLDGILTSFEKHARNHLSEHSVPDRQLKWAVLAAMGFPSGAKCPRRYFNRVIKAREYAIQCIDAFFYIGTSTQLEGPIAYLNRLSYPNSIASRKYNASSPLEIRVFISSTFLDLKDEREYLRQVTFPMIRNICGSRGIQFTEIDLRWGAIGTDAEVLDTCLREIDRCRPYFIGILGDRYGTRIRDRTISELLREKLQAFDFQQLSISDVEMTYGPLMEAQQNEALFYSRHVLPKQLPNNYPEDLRRLHDLKSRIEMRGYRLREGFSQKEKLGEWIAKDLISLIDRIYPAEKDPTRLEIERACHEAFAAAKRFGYVEIPGIFDQLTLQADTLGARVAITGGPGMGKSALLAAWLAKYQNLRPDRHIIVHHVGATSKGSESIGVRRRVMAEIRDRFAFDLDIPSTEDDVANQFLAFLERSNDLPIVLIIDGIDHMDQAAWDLAWLPVDLPTHLTLLVSTARGSVLEALRKRRFYEFEVGPLSIDQVKLIVTEYFRQWGKLLKDSELKNIIAHPQSKSPLFLANLIRELRECADREKTEDILNRCLRARSLGELFDVVLDRLERDHGAADLSRVITALCCAHKGLTEPEMIEAAEVERFQLSRILLGMENQLIRTEGYIKFSCDEFHSAAHCRYLRDKKAVVSIHQSLAKYFQSRLNTERAANALAWHLEQARNLA